MADLWDPEFAGRSPLFEPLRPVAEAFRTSCWPGTADLNRALVSGKPILNANGLPLRFIDQLPRPQCPEDKFEPRIFHRGEVQFRACFWHDFFNALVWMTFPACKAALNRRHVIEIERQRAAGAANRGPVQDALTLFDEGGLIVAVSNPALTRLLLDFQWTELFWHRRSEIAVSMVFFVFGHALYEKALAPFSGVTGRAVVVEVDANFSGLSHGAQHALLDRQVAARINDRACFLTTRELAPVPVFGIPGWDENNARREYYDNTLYFRPAPRVVR